jgi:hypothetical protein
MDPERQRKFFILREQLQLIQDIKDRLPSSELLRILKEILFENLPDPLQITEAQFLDRTLVFRLHERLCEGLHPHEIFAFILFALTDDSTAISTFLNPLHKFW